jgi:uncharacterized protein YdcH (DUF465 family)
MLNVQAAVGPEELLLNYGLAGLVIVLLVWGKLHTNSTVSALEKENAHLWRILEKQHNVATDKVIPALERSRDYVRKRPLGEIDNLVQRLEELLNDDGLHSG